MFLVTLSQSLRVGRRGLDPHVEIDESTPSKDVACTSLIVGVDDRLIKGEALSSPRAEDLSLTASHNQSVLNLFRRIGRKTPITNRLKSGITCITAEDAR